MESNYPDVQTPQPITAHNYKAVKMIKERELANVKKEQDFRQWVPVSRNLGIRKQVWGQTADHSGTTNAPLPSTCNQDSGGDGEEEALLKGREGGQAPDRKTGL